MREFAPGALISLHSHDSNDRAGNDDAERVSNVRFILRSLEASRKLPHSSTMGLFAELYCSRSKMLLRSFGCILNRTKSKDRKNAAKHGVNFKQAEKAFNDPFVVYEIDHAHSRLNRGCFAMGR